MSDEQNSIKSRLRSRSEKENKPSKIIKETNNNNKVLEPIVNKTNTLKVKRRGRPRKISTETDKKPRKRTKRSQSIETPTKKISKNIENQKPKVIPIVIDVPDSPNLSEENEEIERNINTVIIPPEPVITKKTLSTENLFSLESLKNTEIEIENQNQNQNENKIENKNGIEIEDYMVTPKRKRMKYYSESNVRTPYKTPAPQFDTERIKIGTPTHTSVNTPIIKKAAGTEVLIIDNNFHTPRHAYTPNRNLNTPKIVRTPLKRNINAINYSAKVQMTLSNMANPEFKLINTPKLKRTNSCNLKKKSNKESEIVVDLSSSPISLISPSPKKNIERKESDLETPTKKVKNEHKNNSKCNNNNNNDEMSIKIQNSNENNKQKLNEEKVRIHPHDNKLEKNISSNEEEIVIIEEYTKKENSEKENKLNKIITKENNSKKIKSISEEIQMTKTNLFNKLSEVKDTLNETPKKLQVKANNEILLNNIKKDKNELIIETSSEEEIDSINTTPTKNIPIKQKENTKLVFNEKVLIEVSEKIKIKEKEVKNNLSSIEENNSINEISTEEEDDSILTPTKKSQVKQIDLINKNTTNDILKEENDLLNKTPKKIQKTNDKETNIDILTKENKSITKTLNEENNLLGEISTNINDSINKIITCKEKKDETGSINKVVIENDKLINRELTKKDKINKNIIKETDSINIISENYNNKNNIPSKKIQIREETDKNKNDELSNEDQLIENEIIKENIIINEKIEKKSKDIINNENMQNKIENESNKKNIYDRITSKKNKKEQRQVDIKNNENDENINEITKISEKSSVNKLEEVLEEKEFNTLKSPQNEEKEIANEIINVKENSSMHQLSDETITKSLEKKKILTKIQQKEIIGKKNDILLNKIQTNIDSFENTKLELEPSIKKIKNDKDEKIENKSINKDVLLKEDPEKENINKDILLNEDSKKENPKKLNKNNIIKKDVSINKNLKKSIEDALQNENNELSKESSNNDLKNSIKNNEDKIKNEENNNKDQAKKEICIKDNTVEKNRTKSNDNKDINIYGKNINESKAIEKEVKKINASSKTNYEKKKVNSINLEKPFNKNENIDQKT